MLVGRVWIVLLKNKLLNRVLYEIFVTFVKLSQKNLKRTLPQIKKQSCISYVSPVEDKILLNFDDFSIVGPVISIELGISRTHSF